MAETADKTVSFHTLGCKLNTYDTVWHREQFEREGYYVADRYDHSAEKPVFNLTIGLREDKSLTQ